MPLARMFVALDGTGIPTEDLLVSPDNTSNGVHISLFKTLEEGNYVEYKKTDVSVVVDL